MVVLTNFKVWDLILAGITIHLPMASHPLMEMPLEEKCAIKLHRCGRPGFAL